MKLGIMQSYFFPYIGYFQLIEAADTFIIYEHVTFRKKSWITKNRILDKGRNTPVNIQIPVSKKSSFKNINEIEINANIDWKKPLLKLIYFNYKKAPFFNEVYPLIEKCILNDNTKLHVYNSNIIKEICSYLDIKTIIKDSNDDLLSVEELLKTIDVDSKEIKSERIIFICNKYKANTYINPIGGTELYNKEYFNNKKITLNFVKTEDFEYNQFNLPYTPYLSIIDVLMHLGKEGTKKKIQQYNLI